MYCRPGVDVPNNDQNPQVFCLPEHCRPTRQGDDVNSAFLPCPNCGFRVDRAATSCPECGHVWLGTASRVQRLSRGDSDSHEPVPVAPRGSASSAAPARHKLAAQRVAEVDVNGGEAVYVRPAVLDAEEDGGHEVARERATGRSMASVAAADKPNVKGAESTAATAPSAVNIRALGTTAANSGACSSRSGPGAEQMRTPSRRLPQAEQTPRCTRTAGVVEGDKLPTGSPVRSGEFEDSVGGGCHLTSSTPLACTTTPRAGTGRSTDLLSTGRATPRIMQRVYCITLDRRGGEQLGVVVSQHDDQTLLIMRVKGGLVGSWNQATPSLTVKPGDRIIGVNDIRGSAKQLLSECEREALLQMTIQRARVLVDPPRMELQRQCATADAAGGDQAAGGGNAVASMEVAPKPWVCSAPGQSSEADEAAGTAEDAQQHSEGAPASLGSVDRHRDRYYGEDALRTLLSKRDALLVRGSWLADLARHQGTLPRRQDLPAGAAWDPEAIFPGSTARSPAPPIEIAAVSHRWLTPEHPDPKGQRLKAIGRLADEYIRANRRDLAIFIDWCSVYQPPRTLDEQASFMQSLCHISLWFAHQHTWKWMFTGTPDGWQVQPYEERGWATFEWAVSQLAAVPERVLQISSSKHMPEDSWSSTIARCALASRQPPVTPDAFAKLLETKSFTDSVDRGLLEATYRHTFGDLMASAEVLDFSFLGWGDDEIKTLAAALPLCESLRRLYLSWNRASDAGAAALATALPHCGRLCKLALAGNPISDGGKLQLKEAWVRAGRPDDQLDLW